MPKKIYNKDIPHPHYFFLNKLKVAYHKVAHYCINVTLLFGQVRICGVLCLFYTLQQKSLRINWITWKLDSSYLPHLCMSTLYANSLTCSMRVCLPQSRQTQRGVLCKAWCNRRNPLPAITVFYRVSCYHINI